MCIEENDTCAALPLVTGSACDDLDSCTENDVCDEAGVCAGTRLDDPACNEMPELGLVVVTEGPLVGSCYEVGEEFVVNITLGPSSSAVPGGQFLVSYARAVLDFQRLGP